jgi:transcriptional regulator PpsR
VNSKNDTAAGGRRTGGPTSSTAKAFVTPQKSLEGLDTEATASLIATVADLALVVDRKGVIQDMAVGSDDLPINGSAHWVGQSWADTVTLESRPKVEALLRDAATNAERRWRHVNHPLGSGADLPMLYSAVPVGHKGRVVLIGRDMRALASMQQRLVDAQQSLERDYWRLRHVETRYRLLFEVSSEAILIVDADSRQVVEANPAATRLFDATGRRWVGQPFPAGFETRSSRALQALLARVKVSGRHEEIEARGEGGKRAYRVMVSSFRQGDTELFLVRLAVLDGNGADTPAPGVIAKVVEQGPDGFVVTDPAGRVLMANPAFVEFCQLGSEAQLRGESIDRWLGRPGVDLGVLQANLKQHGAVRLFATTLRGEHGATADVEISAVAVPDGDPPCLGFTVRHVGRRLSTAKDGARSSPRSVEQLTQLVGRVPLKDLVRESTDLIEQLCIEAALELTQDNRASAAELLGLSRQSLYVKLRRYGLGDLGSPDS